MTYPTPPVVKISDKTIEGVVLPPVIKITKM
jgi:hypothetical protein